MKFETSAALMALVGVAAARPDAAKVSQGSAKFRREVPQEHSHEKFLTGVGTALNLNNVDQVSDPVFALLGNAAAAAGAGKVTDLDCLQQRVADQAFTNAKAAGDVAGQTNALIFRALERNTGKVGLASVSCTETAVNPEIAAIQQHQDPASDGAAAANKQIALNLAVQLNSIGADPQLALQSGTFAPGDVTDTTGAGNTCDDQNDAVGCAISQNLIVDDATPDEIDAAVAAGGAAAGGAAAGAAATSSAAAGAAATSSAAAGAASSGAAVAAADGCADDSAATATAASNAAASSGAASSSDAASSDATATATGTNVNAFTGAVGSAPVPVTSDAAAAKPFTVNGSQFLNVGAAVQRACDVQKNACANAANGGDASISVSDCDTQQKACVAANASAAKKTKTRRVARGLY
ncbi:Uu.00g054160.m01.CDS01 [Anthostomella pinea]|uniref:Uu.00g054160.m01.CDS01 n=1 Tax=Anthostomella pinea TaxID=933095 RepID=A0AAI8VQV5_9PEZI|nr:Uu.00g054160.m01.CDS01 [Anthostomella pinea]